MAISATEIYRRNPDGLSDVARAAFASGGDPFKVPGLHFTNDSSESKALNMVKGGAIIMAGSGMATLGIPDTAGVPKEFADTTIALPFNDLARVEQVFRERGDKIAAVIIEPVCGNMGCVPPQPGFLEGLRRITERHGLKRREAYDLILRAKQAATELPDA